jgi:hypothetical protein
MIAKGGRTVGAKIRRIRIFLFGLYPVNTVVVGVELVVVELVAYQHAKQDEDRKSDYQVCQVNHRENLIMTDITENVDEKMFNHGFDFSKGFDICFLNFQKPYHNINQLIFSI